MFPSQRVGILLLCVILSLEFGVSRCEAKKQPLQCGVLGGTTTGVVFGGISGAVGGAIGATIGTVTAGPAGAVFGAKIGAAYGSLLGGAWGFFEGWEEETCRKIGMDSVSIGFASGITVNQPDFIKKARNLIGL